MIDRDDPIPDENTPERPSADPSLNARQEAFCQFYVRSHNAARAARLAGYGEASAKNHGYRLLRDRRVQHRLGVLRDALLEEAGARERAWIHTLEEICRRSIGAETYGTAVRAIETQARITGKGIGARQLEAGSEERDAAEEATVAHWIRYGEEAIAESLAAARAERAADCQE